MDSIKNNDSPGMKVWKALFGGDTLWGRMKIFVFILVFILVGGTIFAILI